MTQRSAQQPVDDLERLLAEEPFVRSLARTLVGDSDEIVQQTWLSALQHGGHRVDQPRSWLKRIVHNVAANLHRGDRRRKAHERAAAVRDRVPSPAELIEREERRRALVAAVNALPPSLRTVVLLRYFEGLPPRRIAADLGLPVATVWTQLRRGLELLRARLDAEHGGDRRAWALPMLSFAGPPCGTPLPPLGLPSTSSAVPHVANPLPVSSLWTNVLMTGVITMTTKTKIVAAAAILLAMAGAFVFWSGATPDVSPPTGDGGQSTEDLRSAAQRDKPAVAASEGHQREVVVAPNIAVTGTLLVRARYRDDLSPASGVTMIVPRPGGEFRIEARRGRTDAAGEVTFESMPPGRLYVYAGRSSGRRSTEIEAGKMTELEIVLPVGLTVAGIVVDATGTPIEGALIEVAPLASADFDADVLAISDADGRFAFKWSSGACVVGARAAGHAASPLQFTTRKSDKTAEVRIVLAEAGGVVDGLVVGPDGSPVGNVVVIVGAGRTAGFMATRQGAPPIPALVRSDERGRIYAVGVPPGEQPVVARAGGFAPWRGKCEVVANTTVSLRIQLAKGATLRGVVRDGNQSAVKGARVQIGRWDEIDHYRARTTIDGTFEFTGLPAGTLEVHADHPDLGRAVEHVVTTAAATVECELKLLHGLVLRGRVLDEAGEPVENVVIEVRGSGPGGRLRHSLGRTDAEGRFAVANCPEGGEVIVTARGRAIHALRRTGVDPTAGRLELRVQRTAPASAHVVGRVVDPTGRPVRGASVNVYSLDGLDWPGSHATGKDGSFAIGPLAPGTWAVRIVASPYPRHSVTARKITADSTWTLGEIQLVRGGTAVVNFAGDDSAKVTLWVVDVAERETWSVAVHNRPPRTPALAPGDYRLLVFGQKTASRAVPFSIRAGVETKLEVKLESGAPQRLEFKIPDGVELTQGIRLRVLQGDELVQRLWASVRNGVPIATETWLAPGSYRVTAVVGDLVGSSVFKVSRVATTPVRIELRHR